MFKLPATLVRTCMFSSSTARGSRYSAALPASTSVSLLFTWLRRSRYSLHTNICVTMAISKSRGKLDKKNQFQSYWSFRSVNCFSRLDISSRHSILLRSQSSSSISGTWWRHTQKHLQYSIMKLSFDRRRKLLRSWYGSKTLQTLLGHVSVSKKRSANGQCLKDGQLK